MKLLKRDEISSEEFILFSDINVYDVFCNSNLESLSPSDLEDLGLKPDTYFQLIEKKVFIKDDGSFSSDDWHVYYVFYINDAEILFKETDAHYNQDYFRLIDKFELEELIEQANNSSHQEEQEEYFYDSHEFKTSDEFLEKRQKIEIISGALSYFWGYTYHPHIIDDAGDSAVEIARILVDKTLEFHFNEAIENPTFEDIQNGFLLLLNTDLIRWHNSIFEGMYKKHYTLDEISEILKNNSIDKVGIN